MEVHPVGLNDPVRLHVFAMSSGLTLTTCPDFHVLAIISDIENRYTKMLVFF
jgi:hypothetical protein